MKSEQKIPLVLCAGVLASAGIVFFWHDFHHPRARHIAPSAVSTPAPTPIPAPLTYHTLALGSKPLSALAGGVAKEHIATVLALNRIDAEHIKAKTTLVVPDRFEDFLSYSPFPTSLPAAATVPKLVLISQRIQAFGVYERGMLVRWGPTSTGKKETPTASKLYFINWKGKRVISSIDDSWILPWYQNLDNFEGISMHQYELPGYPASHSCVRLAETDAKWLYAWTDSWTLARGGAAIRHYGTPVIVFGSYAYDKRAPWKMLADDSSATTLSADELTTLVEGYAKTLAARN